MYKNERNCQLKTILMAELRKCWLKQAWFLKCLHEDFMYHDISIQGIFAW